MRILSFLLVFMAVLSLSTGDTYAKKKKRGFSSRKVSKVSKASKVSSGKLTKRKIKQASKSKMRKFSRKRNLGLAKKKGYVGVTSGGTVSANIKKCRDEAKKMMDKYLLDHKNCIKAKKRELDGMSVTAFVSYCNDTFNTSDMNTCVEKTYKLCDSKYKADFDAAVAKSKSCDKIADASNKICQKLRENHAKNQQKASKANSEYLAAKKVYDAALAAKRKADKKVKDGKAYLDKTCGKTGKRIKKRNGRFFKKGKKKSRRSKRRRR